MSSLELLLIPLGFLVGTYGTLVGAGGASILVPVLLPHLPPSIPHTPHLRIARGRLPQRGVRVRGVRTPAAYRLSHRIHLRRGSAAGGDSGAFAVAVVPRRAFNILLASLLLALAAYPATGMATAEDNV